MPKTNLSKTVVAEKTTTTTDNNESVEKLHEELAKRDKEIAELKSMMLSFMANQQGSNANNTNVDQEEGYIYVNNNSVGPVNFVLDTQGKSSYYIEAGIQGRPISKEDIALALKVGTMRKLFELGVLEFVDEKNYKKFGIIKTFDLSEKHVADILSPDNIASNYKDLEQLIRVKKERTLEHELCYKALDLVERGILPRAEESATNIYLNRLFCSGRTTNFNNLLSGLQYKRGSWKQ